MNKILKIILILIVAFFLILGVIWLIGRNSALKNGKEPLTFRQFLGLSTKKNPADSLTGENPSDFNGDGTTPGGDGTNGTGIGGSGNGTGGDNNVNVSQFTSGTTSPATGGISSSGNGSTANGGENGNGSGNPSTNPDADNGISINSPGNSNAGSQPACSDEDMNIEFTPAQLAQLNILQNRFYTLAQTLHSDADVATEIANHDAFTLKANDVLSMYAYCEAQLPAVASLADSRLKLHIATPFWNSYNSDATIPAFVRTKTSIAIPATDPAAESLSFLNFAALDPTYLQNVHDQNSHNPETGASIPGVFGNAIMTGGGIKGPYGLLTLSNPEFVNINGSLLDDGFKVFAPVVEKALRINLW